MDLWFGRIAVFVNLLVYVLIRWPHGRRMAIVAVDEDRKGRLEVFLLTGAGLGTTLFPLIWVASGFPAGFRVVMESCPNEYAGSGRLSKCPA